MLIIQNVHPGPRMSESKEGIANALILGCDNLPKEMSSGEQRGDGGLHLSYWRLHPSMKFPLVASS
jgi:hypothetical protein